MPAFSAESSHWVPELPTTLSAKFRPLRLDWNYSYLLLLATLSVILCLEWDVNLWWCELIILRAALCNLSYILLIILKLTKLAPVPLRVVIWILRRINNEIWDDNRGVCVNTQQIAFSHLRSGVQMLLPYKWRLEWLPCRPSSLMSSFLTEQVCRYLLFKGVFGLVSEHFFLLFHQKLLFAVSYMSLCSFLCELPIAVWTLNSGESGCSIVDRSMIQIWIFLQGWESAWASSQVVSSAWVDPCSCRRCWLSFLFNSLELVPCAEMWREHGLLRW